MVLTDLSFAAIAALGNILGGLAAARGAKLGIKVISGLGTPLYNQLLRFDLRHVSFMKTSIVRRPECRICGGVNA